MTMPMNHDQRLIDVQVHVGTARGALYKALAEIYAWRVEAVDEDKSDHSVWKKWAEKQYVSLKWGKNEATFSNIFTTAVRLSFNADPRSQKIEGVLSEKDHYAVSKYAKVLQYIHAKDIGLEKDENDDKKMVAGANIVTDVEAYLANDGIAELYKRAVGTTTSRDDKNEVAKGKAVLSQKLSAAQLVALPNDASAGYHLALVHVDAKGKQVQVVEIVAGETTDETKRWIKSFADASVFKSIVNIIRFADIAKLGGDYQRPIIIENTAKGANVLASLQGTTNSLVAYGELAALEGMDDGTYVIFQDEAEGIKHLWANARGWDWSFAKTGDIIEGDTLTGPAIVLRHETETVADWIAKQTAALRNSGKSPKAKYSNRDGVKYKTNAMYVQLADTLSGAEVCVISNRRSWNKDHVVLDRECADKFLKWTTDEKDKLTQEAYYFQFDANGFTVSDRSGSTGTVLKSFTFEKAGTNGIKFNSYLILNDLVNTLRTLKAFKSDTPQLHFSGNVIQIIANGNTDKWMIYIPAKAEFGRDDTLSELVCAA